MDSERSEAWNLLNCINYSELTMEELNNLAAVVRAAQKRLGKSTVNNLKIGDTVSWNSGRKRGKYAGMKLIGEVIKINKTRVKVNAGTGLGIWNVPGSLLTRVA
jgi:hypothetical protein